MCSRLQRGGSGEHEVDLIVWDDDASVDQLADAGTAEVSSFVTIDLAEDQVEAAPRNPP
jgi:hypothetical protein